MADTNFKFCTACGRKVALNAQFCAGCGTALGAKEKSVQAPTQKVSAARPEVVRARKECERILEGTGRKESSLNKVRDMFSEKEELINYLDSDEQFVFPLYNALGTHNLLKKGRKDSFNGHLVATTKRLIILKTHFFGGKIETVSLPYSEILKIKIDRYGSTGAEQMTGVYHHNSMRFTIKDDRQIMIYKLETSPFMNVFWNYVKSMVSQ